MLILRDSYGKEMVMDDKFIQTVRDNIRLRGYSIATEKTYILWIKRFIYFIDSQHPLQVKTSRITDYLTYLASKRHVSVNTQKTALNALVYFFQKYNEARCR